MLCCVYHVIHVNFDVTGLYSTETKRLTLGSCFKRTTKSLPQPGHADLNIATSYVLENLMEIAGVLLN